MDAGQTTQAAQVACSASSAFWSALGGFVGVTVFYLIRLLFSYLNNKPKIIRTYLCCSNQNQGQTTEAEGELMHHHGKKLDNSFDLKKIEAPHHVWEWTKTPVGRSPIGESIIYGPYTSDFPKSGTYSATFRIKAIGLSSPQHIQDDTVLLLLDVNKIIAEHFVVDNKIVHESTQHRLAIKHVRAGELAEKDWVDFKLYFYSDGQGVWEYRVVVNDGLDNKPDNVGPFGVNVRIFFDTVTIREEKEMTLPAA